MRTDVGADVLHDLGGHCASNFLPGFERDVGVNGVALDVMLVADDGGLSYSRVAADGALDFGGAKVVAVYELANFLGTKDLETVPCGLGGRVNHDWGWSKFVPAFHSSSYEGKYMGMPAGVVIDFGGVRIYNTGDTCVFGDMALIAEMYKPEVLILPVGGHFTMDAFEAKKAIELVKPKVVIPVHYNTWPPLEMDVQKFKREVESELQARVEVLAVGETFELVAGQV